MIVVPDASVILKWILEKEKEPDFVTAFQILEAYQAETIGLALPSLWRYEVANILNLKQPSHAQDSMGLLLTYGFQEEALHRDYCLAVLSFLKEVRGISFYDAAYHVLAIRLEGIYVTADIRYVRKAGQKGRVVLLSEWSSMSD